MATRTTAGALLAFLSISVLLAATGQAEIPDKMNYQVMLTDDEGSPIADQSVELIFRLFDQSEILRWTETHNTTTNSIGVVSVKLGATNSLSTVDFSVPLWLEIEVDGEPLSPENWRDIVYQSIAGLQWEQVMADVRPFLEQESQITLLTRENLVRVLENK